MSQIYRLKSNEVFKPQEGFYAILEGSLTAVGRSGIDLTKLGKGEIFGSDFNRAEIDLIAEEETKIELLKAESLDEYKKLAALETNTFQKVYKKTFDALLQKKNMGLFIINLVVFLSLFSIFLPYLHKLVTLHIGTLTSIPLILFVNLLMFMRLYVSKMPLSTIGITKKNLGKSLWLGLIVSLVMMVLIIIVKLLLLKLIPGLFHKLFYPYAERMYAAYGIKMSAIQVTGFALLYAAHSVLQELVARGGLQGMFKQFFTFKNGNYVALLLASLVFASAHSYYGLQMVLEVFIPGLVWGWLYERTGNIFGPILSHILVGTYQFQLIGN